MSRTEAPPMIFSSPLSPFSDSQSHFGDASSNAFPLVGLLRVGRKNCADDHRNRQRQNLSPNRASEAPLEYATWSVLSCDLSLGL